MRVPNNYLNSNGIIRAGIEFGNVRNELIQLEDDVAVQKFVCQFSRHNLFNNYSRIFEFLFYILYLVLIFTKIFTKPSILYFIFFEFSIRIHKKQMTNRFRSSEGDWVQSNLSKHDMDDQVNLIEIGSIQNASVNHNNLYERIQHRLFVCGACGEKVIEPNLSKHHLLMHSELPFIMDMYELFEIDERIQCLACNVEILENNFTKHMALYHPDILLDSVNGNEQSIEVPQCEEQPSTTQVICNESRLYNCQLCNAHGISEENLPRHHSRAHPDVSDETNIFILTKIIRKITCDICYKQMKINRIDKHRLMHHPEKYGPEKMDSEIPEGFCQVLVSHEEIKRLQNLQRIYENKGRLYLKDSR